MTDNRKSGIALIAGSLGGLLTMAIHPVAPAIPQPGQLEPLALLSAVTHSLALVSVLALFLGAFGLTRRIAAPDRLAFVALVTYGLAIVAIFQAGTMSGFILPGIMRLMLRDAAFDTAQAHLLIAAFFQINQANSRIFTVAASAAVLLWSASALRHGGFGRAKAIYGCILAPLLILGIATGHLQLNVHGMGLVAVAQALWFIPVGAELCADTYS